MSKQPSKSGGWGLDAAKGLSEASKGLAIAIGFALPVVSFVLLGRLIDGWLGTKPWLAVVGALVG